MRSSRTGAWVGGAEVSLYPRQSDTKALEGFDQQVTQFDLHFKKIMCKIGGDEMIDTKLEKGAQKAATAVTQV